MKNKDFTEEGVTILLTLWKSYQEKGVMGEDWFYEDYAEEVANLFKDKKILEGDILQLQHREVPIVVLMEVNTHLIVGESGLTEHKAIEYAHKIELIILSHTEATGGNVKQVFIDRLVEDNISDDVESIMAGTYDKNVLTLLDTLPPVTQWDNEGVIKKRAVGLYDKIFNIPPES
jgi:hypothetical protein